MKKLLFLLIAFYSITGSAYPAQFLLKNGDTSNPDTTKDRRGCYKDGYIVEVAEDGKFRGEKDGKQYGTHHTVLEVTGLKVDKTFQEPKFGTVEEERVVDNAEYQTISSAKFETYTLNGKSVNLYDGRFFSQPTVLSTDLKTGNRTIKANVLGTHTRRRFQLPKEKMDLIRSKGHFLKISIEDWEKDWLPELIDYAKVDTGIDKLTVIGSYK